MDYGTNLSAIQTQQWQAHFICQSDHGPLVRRAAIHHFQSLRLPPASDPGANQALRYVGLLMRQVFLNIHRAYHVILRKYGIPVETLEAWSSNIDQGEPLQQIAELHINVLKNC